MDFLKEILGDLYSAVEGALKSWNEKPENKDNQVKLANIGNGDYVSKNKYEALEATKVNLETQLSTVNETLKKFEGIEPEELKGEIATLQAEISNQKAIYETQIADMQFNSTLEAAIMAVGGRSSKAIEALLDINTLKSSKNQSEDIKAALEVCQKENGYLFGTDEPIKNPIKNTGGTGGNADANIVTLRAAMGLPTEQK